MADITTEELEELENEVTSQNTKLKKMEEFVRRGAYEISTLK